MNSLFDISTRSGIRMDKYLHAWSLCIFNNKNLATLSTPERVKEQQKLAASVKKIWKLFNAGRKNLTKHYLEEPDFLRAYAASFLIPNVQRIYSIAQSSDVFPQLENLTTENKTLRIIDFGSGPLAASTGIVAALCHNNLVNFEITAVERSHAAFQMGNDLLTAAFVKPERLRTSVAPSIQKVEGTANVIVAANVFNEIPEAHREKTLRSLMEKLENNGVLIILEPGQDVHSRALSSLRNSILKNPPFAFRILAPCLHRNPCALHSKSERPDWCWFQNTWKPPMLLAELDKYSGLRHEELNYSYWVIQKTRTHAEVQHFARVLSNPIPVGGGQKGMSFLRWARANTLADNQGLLRKATAESTFLKTLLCTNEGDLESAIHNNDNIKRGDVVSENSVPCRCKERLAPEATPRRLSRDLLIDEHNPRDIEPRSPRSQTKRPIKTPTLLSAPAKSPKPRR